MNKDRFVKIVVYVPVKQADKVRVAMAEAGAGRQGNYDNVSGSCQSTGRFRPLENASPAIGKKGEIAVVKEERIEMLSTKQGYPKVIEAIKKVHPYEEPSIEVIELLYPELP
jgi:hypothetical protein